MRDPWVRLRRSLSERGLAHTWESALSVPQDYVFDFVNGTDTLGRLGQRELGVVSEHTDGAQDYVPTRGRAFLKLMQRLDLPKDGVFVDFGSGKGKILLLASQLGFSRVVGVEFSERLCACARRNVGRFQRTPARGTGIEVVCADAAAFPIPDEANAFYLYNPFGMSVIDQVMQNIKASLDRRWRSVWLIYNHPVYVTPVEQSLQLREVMNYTYGGHDFIVLSNHSAGPRSPR